jgi:dTDP-4-dehydrorhamnose 3,5-epimerase
MIFEPAHLEGAFLVHLERREDERGFFARSFCQNEFDVHGLPQVFVQCNVSFNRTRGTLRGMHFQRDPRQEGKLVRCTMGAALDVIIDLRKDSPTYCRWQGFELTAENRRAVYIPPGFAHGFQTLVDGVEMFYQMNEFYVPELAGGVRWDDPAFDITWPVPNPILSERDRSYSHFRI